MTDAGDSGDHQDAIRAAAVAEWRYTLSLSPRDGGRRSVGSRSAIHAINAATARPNWERSFRNAAELPIVSSGTISIRHPNQRRSELYPRKAGITGLQTTTLLRSAGNARHSAAVTSHSRLWRVQRRPWCLCRGLRPVRLRNNILLDMTSHYV